jgi:predicted transglutaminase-like cysteine proteinase
MAARDSDVEKSQTRCLAAVLFLFCLLVFRITAAHGQGRIDEPFGVTAVPVPETVMAATWKDVLIEIDNDLSIVNRCRETVQSCPSSAVAFLTVIKEGEGHEGLAQIGHLNRAATFAIKAFNRAPAYDEWNSPLTILSRGSGDCKHYAVLKYALFRELGFSADALKILIVEVRSTRELHAILSVRTEKGRWLLLDNLTLMLVESSMALAYYDPLYELDQNGVRQFVSQSRPTQLAQSQQRSGVLPRQHGEGS